MSQRPAIRLEVSVATLIVACCGSVAAASPSLYETVAPILAHRDELSRVWPGYWSEEMPFLVYEPEGDAILYTARTPPAPYRRYDAPSKSALPEGLLDRLYWHEGVPPGLHGQFDTRYTIGKKRVAAIPQHDSVDELLDFLFHEIFHAYQSGKFSGDTTVSTFVDPGAITPALIAMAEVERRLLRDALREDEPRAVRDLARQYLAVRGTREDLMPADAVNLESERERTEGSAFLVGLQAMVAALDRSDDEVLRKIEDQLAKPLGDFGGSIQDSMFRWRVYGTGAAIGLLLDREPLEGWRKRMEDGQSFSILLADAMEFESTTDRQALARQAMDRRGYQDLLRKGDRLLVDAPPSIGKFYARPAHAIIEVPQAMMTEIRTSFSAGDLFQLDDDVMLVQDALYTAEFDRFSVTAQHADLLFETRGVMRVTIALAGLPDLAGVSAGAETRLENVSFEIDGLTVSVDRPVLASRTSDSLLLHILESE
jgi:hypothetical protein